MCLPAAILLSGNIDWKAGTSLSAVDKDKFALAMRDTMLSSALVMSNFKELASSPFFAEPKKLVMTEVVADGGTKTEEKQNNAN